jgi:hypothetical protein
VGLGEVLGGGLEGVQGEASGKEGAEAGLQLQGAEAEVSQPQGGGFRQVQDQFKIEETETLCPQNTRHSHKTQDIVPTNFQSKNKKQEMNMRVCLLASIN